MQWVKEALGIYERAGIDKREALDKVRKIAAFRVEHTSLENEELLDECIDILRAVDIMIQEHR